MARKADARDAYQIPHLIMFELAKLKTWFELSVLPPAPIQWVVENICARGEVTLVAAPGGVGKSWWAMEIATHVIDGSPFHESFKTEMGNVLYLDNENGLYENQRRANKLNRDRPKPIRDPENPLSYRDVYFHTVPDNFFKADSDHIKAVQKLISQSSASLVIIDSFVSIIPDGKSENSATDVRAVFDDLSRMIQADEDGVKRKSPPALLVIHHTSKIKDDDGWSSYRGSSDVLNAVSVLVGMKPVSWVDGRTGETVNRVYFRWEKMRKGVKPSGEYSFAIEDRGHDDPSNPMHWVAYTSYGKVVPMGDRMLEWVLDALTEPKTKTRLEKDVQDSHAMGKRPDLDPTIMRLIEAGSVETVAMGMTTYYRKKI